VQVSVENGLPCGFTRVENGPIPIEATLGSDLIGSQKEVSCNGRTISSDSCSILCVNSRNKQYMCGSLGIEIVKCHNIFSSQHDVSRDLSINDFAEDAVGF
jgi:hypothetical protein